MANNDQPATKADITALDNRITGLEARLIEAIHRRETRLLTAFEHFAEMDRRRLSEVERESSGLK